MKPARLFFSLVVLSGALAAQAVEQPKLSIGFRPLLVCFSITSPHDTFLGATLLSPSPDLAHYFVGLPPLLANHVVVDVGLGQGHFYNCAVNELLLPPGIFIYAQGVTFDGAVFDATRVRDFVLDVTVPDPPR
ncbi:MAG TPA: hypothetical protein VFD82_16740 [Planctomycetota bacterium]|nr:hypothetical protein [Planctomycetota bacterium]